MSNKKVLSTDGLLARLVPQPTSPALAAAKDVACKAFTAPQTTLKCILGAADRSLNERPTAPSPVAIAAVDELVRSARKTTFRGILTGRKPRYECGHIEESEYFISTLAQAKRDQQAQVGPLPPYCIVRFSHDAQTSKAAECVCTVSFITWRCT